MGWKFSAQWLQDPRRRDSADSRAHTPGWPGAGGRLRAQRGKGNGWWDWKPEKRHLEVLFTAGQLMVRERRNFQRVYDLAERVMPEWNDEQDLPSPDLARRDMVRASCRALGLVKTGWVADYYRLKRGNTTPCSTSWRTRGAVAGTSGGVAARSLRSRLPWPMSWSGPRRAPSRRATPPCSRPLTRWCGIASGPASCLALTIASSAIPRPQAPVRLFRAAVAASRQAGGQDGRQGPSQGGCFEVKSLYLEDGSG